MLKPSPSRRLRKISMDSDFPDIYSEFCKTYHLKPQSLDSYRKLTQVMYEAQRRQFVKMQGLLALIEFVRNHYDVPAEIKEAVRIGLNKIASVDADLG